MEGYIQHKGDEGEFRWKAKPEMTNVTIQDQVMRKYFALQFNFTCSAAYMLIKP